MANCHDACRGNPKSEVIAAALVLVVMTKSIWLDIALATALALAVFRVFQPLGKADFVHLDDEDYVRENPHVTSGLSVSNLKWAFTSGHHRCS